MFSLVTVLALSVGVSGSLALLASRRSEAGDSGQKKCHICQYFDHDVDPVVNSICCERGHYAHPSCLLKFLEERLQNEFLTGKFLSKLGKNIIECHGCKEKYLIEGQQIDTPNFFDSDQDLKEKVTSNLRLELLSLIDKMVIERTRARLLLKKNFNVLKELQISASLIVRESDILLQSVPSAWKTSDRVFN